MRVFYSLVGCVAIFLLNLGAAYGHIRYVLNEDEIAKVSSERAAPTTLLQGDMLAVVMLAGFLFVVGFQFLGLFLSKKPLIKTLEGSVSPLEEYVPLILRIMVGGFLILSGLADRLFAPQSSISFAGSMSMIAILQIVAGTLLLLGLLTKIGAALLVVLVGASFVQFGVHGLDQFVLLGVAVILFFEGGLKQSIDSLTIAKISSVRKIGTYLDAYKVYSMPILRITLGISLIWLGLTEKLLAPELTEAAVIKYSIPYFPELRLFVFFFGFFEVLLGAHYLLGIFNRMISLIYLGLLGSAFYLFGEGINHLHLFGVTLAFLIRGAGSYRMYVVLQGAEAITPKDIITEGSA
ncbi:MAG: hypothetical protein FJ358_01665 [Thaumarchaeota archaeon]|nr:hypothetical protein [Nitrososphaerota archaeon]